MSKDMVKPYGEVKTTLGTIIITNKGMLKLARDLLNALEGEFERIEKEAKVAIV